jgi:hypothetical protein
MIIAHQTDRQELVGLAEVARLQKGDYQGRQYTFIYLKAQERLGAEMTHLKTAYARVAKLDAYRQGKIQTVYAIDKVDAEYLIKVARKAVNEGPPRKQSRAVRNWCVR